MKEKVATPNIMIMAPMSLSSGVCGLKSPKPMVERVVSAKYQTISRAYMVVNESSVTHSLSQSSLANPTVRLVSDNKSQMMIYQTIPMK
jgi:hypothetical protein